MKNIKKSIFVVIMSSIMGGTFAMGSYHFFLTENNNNITVDYNEKIKLANYVFDTTDVLVPQGLNFVYTSKIVTPTVVHIRTIYEGKNYSSRSPFEDMFRDFFGDRYDREREAPKQRGSGSGVIISKNGYIITNNHVIDNASEVEVLLSDNRSFKATLEGVDPTTDLAVLKIEADNLPTTKFGNSDQVQIGEWVLAVGSPYEFRSTVTAGIVSAKARNIGILRDKNNLQI